MPLHVSSTVVLITGRSKLYYTASGIIKNYRWPSGAEVGRGLCTGRPPTGVTIPDAVEYNFDLPVMSTTVLETCRGI